MPKELGGVALPDMQLYSLASKLSQVWTLRHSDKEEALYQLWQEVLQTELPPQALETTSPGCSKPINNPILISQRYILTLANHTIKAENLGPLTPLWHNKKLAPLDKLTPPKSWLEAGIYILGQVWTDQGIASFAHLKETHSIPNSQWFTYYKIRKAAQQSLNFRNTQLSVSSVVEVFKQEQTGHKIMFYRALMTPIIQRSPLKVRDRWETDIEQITDDQWDQTYCTTLEGKDPTYSTYPEWEKSIQETQAVEHLIARRNTIKQHLSAWQLWILESV
ncbi:hypothetical protein XELAEV_18028983mg [Xenopus laevis]|uniref:Uncharacterized protein n=1 Tax=Xenopus laevis TaxID=8355 RepID=A0A974HH96_XENLA|nr:hypothetical protein XELAEV_18028983mg [Xenopus laevis]